MDSLCATVNKYNIVFAFCTPIIIAYLATPNCDSDIA